MDIDQPDAYDMMRHLLPSLLLCLPLSALAESVEHFSGLATDLKTGQPLYREVHEQHYDGTRWLGGNIRYLAPDGRLLGEKTLDFSRSRYVPLMRFSQPGIGYEDSITGISDQDITVGTRRQNVIQQTTVPRQPEQAADSGFNAYVVDQLPSLAQGRTLHMRFVVVGQRDQYRFRILPQEQLQLGGERALRLRVEPDSLLRWVVDPLTLVYGLESRRLLRYEGVSNLINPQTGKAWQVRIRFDDAQK